MENIIKQINEVKKLEDPLPVLLDMKTNLIALSSTPSNITDFFKHNHLVAAIRPLFDVLNSSDSDQVTVAVDILRIILTNIDQKVALAQLSEQYLRGLHHPHEAVRLLVLKQLLRCCEEYYKQGAAMLLRERPLLNSILKLLGDKSLNVVKHAHKIILGLSRQNNPNIGYELVFNSAGFLVLREVMKVSDSARFHVYDIVVEVGCLNENALTHMATFGLIGHLLNEITSSDVLAQLNSLELLSKLAMNVHGVQFLQNAGIIAKLSVLLSDSRDSDAVMLLPGIVKFFGHLGSVQPALLVEDHSSVLAEIMRVASDSDDLELSLQLIAFETLAHVGATLEGKNALMKYSAEMEETLRKLCSHLRSAPTEMQVRLLDSIAELFYLENEQRCEDVVSKMEVWFEHLAEETAMKYLVGLAKQPFPEVVASCLRILKSVARLPWGIKKMAKEPGMLEWLLDRSSFHDKSTKELRWEVVGILSKDPIAKEFFSDEVHTQIKKFYEQGPFYVEAELSVAFEKE